ncbi:MAG: class A beta-lactamase, subclass A2 [Bacteroidota bacterium]
MKPRFFHLLLCIFFVISTGKAQYQNNTSLRLELESLTNPYKASIGIAVIHIETGDTLTLRNQVHYPMQSVYKFPLALYILHLVDEHKLLLSQKIHVTQKDVAPETWSPLKDKYPKGNIDVTLSDLLYYAVSLSDNVACDLLFKLINGPSTVTAYLQQHGYSEIKLVSTEEEMHRNFSVQFKNWSRPMVMSKLLEGLYRHQYLSVASNALLMRLMTESSNSAARIKGLLPNETIVAHKTGTGGTSDDHIRSACNDVGIITLPDNTHIALSIFVSRSSEAFENDEKIIARISKAVYDAYAKH